MKRRARFWAVAITGGLAVSGWAELIPLRVVGERVNLRARPALEAEVVGQVSEGSELTAKTLGDEWVEVVPPASVDLWVHQEFLEGNTVKAKLLKVRAGPGINYSVVGSLTRGEAVEVRGTFNEWVKIAPPASCSLWISRKYVEPARKVVAAVARRPAGPTPAGPTPAEEGKPPAPAPAPPSAPVAAVRERPPAPLPPPTREPAPATRWQIPAEWALVPLQGQGNRVEREGYLMRVGFLVGRPSNYRLVQFAGGRSQTLCFVVGPVTQLRAWVGQRMLVRGREYWLQNVRHPVVVAEQLEPRPFPAPERNE